MQVGLSAKEFQLLATLVRRHGVRKPASCATHTQKSADLRGRWRIEDGAIGPEGFRLNRA
jgi:hypothetical protein